MSAEQFNPKFEIEKLYTCDEFIYRLECLKKNANPEDVQAFIVERIEWARSLGPKAIIGFRQNEEGTVYPEAHIISSYEPAPDL